MIFMIVYLFCMAAAVGLGALAAWSDFKGMIIPNHIALAVLALFFAAYGAAYAAGADVFYALRSHLLAGGVAFAATFAMYTLKTIGGGDSKLITAFAFWAGMKGMPVFLFYMVMAGGVAGLVALYLKKKKPVAAPPEGSWIARAQAGESVVPYGIPIVIGAAAAFLKMGLLLPESLRLFLIPN